MNITTAKLVAAMHRCCIVWLCLNQADEKDAFVGKGFGYKSDLENGFSGSMLVQTDKCSILLIIVFAKYYDEEWLHGF